MMWVQVVTVISLLLWLVVGCTGQPGGGVEQGGGAAEVEWPVIRLEPVVEGLNKPLYLTHAGDGSGQLYLLEQAGRIRVVADGRVEPNLFMDLTDRVLSQGMEQGLLGLAFDPNFADNGRFYLHYSAQPHGQTVVARYHVDGNNPQMGDPASEEILLRVEQPYANHNGGSLLFGPDGYLYLALGDGGSGGDPGNRAQDLEVLLGKILRLDVSEPGPYRIPETNPFVGRSGRDEIWSYGLRNPWRISFDRETGDLYIADVGQSQWEEINLQPAASPGGENWGWKVWEGTHRFSPGELHNAIFPIAEYSHGEGDCSITGGYAYRGQGLPAMAGVYLYADYCSGRIWGLKRAGERWVSALLLDTEANIASFGEDEQGELYVVDLRGSLYRVVEAK